MPRQRSPNRKKAEQLWLDSNGSKPLVEIAKELGLGDSQIRKWKNQDEWERKLEEKRKGNVTNQNSGSKGNVTKSKRGAPEKNKNAKGNKGGAPEGNNNATGNPGGGAPLRNDNAVTTGEHATIWLDALDEEERELYGRVGVDSLAQVEEEIALLTIRERRMLQKIQEIKAGLTEKERRVLMERVKVTDIVPLHDEKTGQSKNVKVDRHQLVETEIEETEFRKIDDLLNIEDALTRVQDKKLKAIQLKAKMLNDSEMLGIAKERLEIDKAKVKGGFDPLATMNQELREASRFDLKQSWGSRDAQKRQSHDDGQV